MPGLPNSVLVAVDFGEASARAVALAGAVAVRCGTATLRLLHAESLDAPLYFTHDQIEALEQQRRATREQAEQFLGKFGRANTAQPFTTVVADGPAAEAILHAMRDADLLVMGTHGRHGPKRWWLGSVAERVLRQMDRPMLIVRAQPGQSPPPAFQRVIVHAPTRHGGTAALEYAQTVARCFKGEAVDRRGDEIDSALETPDATLLVAAAPQPITAEWLSTYGEPLVRSAKIPVLFVPESRQSE
jgi:nucleotide-binding universal stress UspA family protein